MNDEIGEFLSEANNRDSALQGHQSSSIFENAKEEAAARIGLERKAEDLRLKGNDCMKSKEYKESIRYYDEAINLNSTESSSYCNRAQAYLKLKDFNACIKDCSKAIDIKPSYVKAYFRRGKAYSAMEEFEKAIEDFQLIQELNQGEHKQVNSELLQARAHLEEKKKTHKKMKIQEVTEEEVDVKDGLV